MSLQDTLSKHVTQAVQTIYNAQLPGVEFQATRKEFAGDITVVVFPMLRVVKGNPVQIGEAIGAYLVEHVAEVEGYNVVKGFLNIEINQANYISFFNGIINDETYGFVTPNPEEKAVMVEYSSPNTNKPLHLGHIRNNLLGYSVAEILKASGKKVYKTQIINDRGIHICKSMLAWERFGNGETPESTGLKGDKLVGNYYVKFDQEYKKEKKELLDKHIALLEVALKEHKDNGVFGKIDSELILIADNSLRNFIKENINKDDVFLKEKVFFVSDSMLVDLNEIEIINLRNVFVEAITLYSNGESLGENGLYKKAVQQYEKEEEKHIPIMLEAQKMLLKWEAGDDAVVSLWKKMNGWVYDGFNVTYKNLGVDFDALYFESETYLLGKEFVVEGLKSGVFFQKEDGSVWCDLTADGLDEKIVQRADGTAVYMTQDIGTAIQRIKDYPDVGGMVYTVGNEQDYHFQVLFLILKKLGFDWAKNLFHLSYGMVDLPSGKMKSREGTVVDADDLVSEMTETAGEISEELGKLDGYSADEKQVLYHTIGLGALKYYILKVDPKKRILFDPKESIDFQGNTGPFIQYTYARIQSILRKANVDTSVKTNVNLHDKEKSLLKQIQLFPEVIQHAATNHSPALIANYTYELVKEFNSFYQNVSILGADDINEKIFRVQLSQTVATIIKNAFGLLGIHVPKRM